MNILETQPLPSRGLQLLRRDCNWDPLWEFAASHLGLEAQGHRAGSLEEWSGRKLGREEQGQTGTCQHFVTVSTLNPWSLQSELTAAPLLPSTSHVYFLLVSSNLKLYGDSGKDSCRLARLIQYKITAVYPLKTWYLVPLVIPYIISKYKQKYNYASTYNDGIVPHTT